VRHGAVKRSKVFDLGGLRQYYVALIAAREMLSTP
jgi:hypothetical protein